MLQRIGRYEILERIGGGAFGIVYRARDTVLDRVVAVKTINQPVTDDPKFLEDLQREPRLAARISHPNVVTVYDFQVEAGTAYIVMEFLPDSLDKHIRPGQPIPYRRAVEIAIQVSRGLAYAHAQGVIHRDIKPGNILLTSDGNAQVTDFGIARAMVSSSRVDQTYGTGTTLYMSPEQWSDGPIDHRADIYSLGVTLFEMLTGAVPFRGQSFHALLVQHRESPVPPVPRHLGIPRSVGNVVRRAMAKSSEDRFDNAEAMATALEAALPGATGREQRPADNPSGDLPVATPSRPPEQTPSSEEQRPQPFDRPTEPIPVEPPPRPPQQPTPAVASGRTGGGSPNWLMFGGIAATVILVAVFVGMVVASQGRSDAPPPRTVGNHEKTPEIRDDIEKKVPMEPKPTSGASASLSTTQPGEGIPSTEVALLSPIADWHERWGSPDNSRPMDKQDLLDELSELVPPLASRLSDPLPMWIEGYQASHLMVYYMNEASLYRAIEIITDADLDLDTLDSGSPCVLPDASTLPKFLEKERDALSLECLAIDTAEDFLAWSRHLAERTWLNPNEPSVIIQGSSAENDPLSGISEWHRQWEPTMNLSDQEDAIKKLDQLSNSIPDTLKEPLGSAEKVYSLSHMVKFMITSNLVNRAIHLISDAGLDFIPLDTLCDSSNTVDIPENLETDLNLFRSECVTKDLAALVLYHTRDLAEGTWLKPKISTAYVIEVTKNIEAVEGESEDYDARVEIALDLFDNTRERWAEMDEGLTSKVASISHFTDLQLVASDAIPEIDILVHDIRQVEAEFFVLVPPQNLREHHEFVYESAQGFRNVLLSFRRAMNAIQEGFPYWRDVMTEAGKTNNEYNRKFARSRADLLR